MKDRRAGIVEMLIRRDGERRKKKRKKNKSKNKCEELEFGGKWRRKKVIGK